MEVELNLNLTFKGFQCWGLSLEKDKVVSIALNPSYALGVAGSHCVAPSDPNINQCLSQRHSERRTCNFLHKGGSCANIQPCSAVSAEKHFVHGSLKCRNKLMCFFKFIFVETAMRGDDIAWSLICSLMCNQGEIFKQQHKFYVSNCFYLHLISHVF